MDEHWFAVFLGETQGRSHEMKSKHPTIEVIQYSHLFPDVSSFQSSYEEFMLMEFMVNQYVSTGVMKDSTRPAGVVKQLMISRV